MSSAPARKSVTVGEAAAAIELVSPVDGRRRAAPRWAQALNLLIYLAAIAAIGVTINYFAARQQYRAQIDATKTRAYSLSEQSQKLLAGLQGQWTIAMLVSDANVPRSMRKQIDEVLRRYTDAMPNIRVLKIDPDNPRTLTQYETLLRDLQNLYKDDVTKYDAALDAGESAFKELQVFSQQHAIEVVAAAQSLPEQDPSRKKLEQSAAALQLVADKGDLVLGAVKGFRKVDVAQPIPDYDGARSTLYDTLHGHSLITDAVAAALRAWLQQANLDPRLKAFAQRVEPIFDNESQSLAAVADALLQLPPLELSEIGRQLGEGEAAVILAPKRATVIPSRQLFPKSNLNGTRDGGVTFDQRFRGEQVISAAIRSLMVAQMPRVVFVHAEDGSLLQPRNESADLTGVASVLRASRYVVQEWNVVKSPVRSEAQRGQKTVWIIIPPLPVNNFQTTPAVRAMHDATDRLLTDGENVLLSEYFSLLPRYGAPDPFAALPAPFGIRPDTATRVYEQSLVAQGENQILTNQAVENYSDETAIGRAVDGQQTAFIAPVPLRRIEGDLGSALAGVDSTIHLIAAIEPSPARWLEKDWTSDMRGYDPRPDQRLNEPVPVALAAERANPMGGGNQRLIVVGSGGWMLTSVADQIATIGGGRVALVFPGNHELMLASVAWLAGMDDLIAASPMSQEVSRLRGITPEVHVAWRWIIAGGVPLACVMIGLAIWLWRRM